MTAKIMATSLKRKPGFRLKGVDPLKVFMHSSYYTLTMSYSFKWKPMRRRFEIVEYFPQRVICAVEFVLMTLQYIWTNWTALQQVSSRKEDLLKAFLFVRHISSVISYLVALYTAVGKRGSFLRLLDLVSQKANSGYRVHESKFQWETSLLWGATGAFYLLILFSQMSLVSEHGLYESALLVLGDWSQSKSYVIKRPSIVSALVPEKGTVKGYFFSYVVITLTTHSNIAFWSEYLFTLTFLLFLRANLKSFRKFVGSITRSEIDQLYKEYLYLKSLQDCVIDILGPRLFSLFISLIPFASYFLSDFSQMANNDPTAVLVFHCFWAGMTLAIFVIAASTSALTGNIKRVLLMQKPRWDQLCFGTNCHCQSFSSDLSLIIMDMPNGNELGISCFGYFYFDYNLIGSMLISIVTFTIILIQAQ